MALIKIEIECENKSWKEVSLLVFLRAGHTCEHPRCVTKRGLEIHHKKLRKDGGTDHPDNLEVLCSKHHRRKHNGGHHRMPFVRSLINNNDLSYSIIAGYLGVTQPAVSMMLSQPPAILSKLIMLKNYINLTLKKNYTIEELFTEVEDDPDKVYHKSNKKK